jgi:hypothetical protein
MKTSVATVRQKLMGSSKVSSVFIVTKTTLERYVKLECNYAHGIEMKLVTKSVIPLVSENT